MDGTITISYNKSDKSLETKNILIEKLYKVGFKVSDYIEEDTILIISIGGDGSFLKAIHKFNFTNIPIIGINTGHLGFFAEISPDTIDDFIKSYINKEYCIQQISPLEASICTKSKCVNVQAINEIVIKNIMSRTVHLDLQVNSIKIEHFSGDGMLISTPTGSTAYNYSAGGSIVDPNLNLLQLTPIAPMNTNAYRSFTSSIILPTNSIITISPEYEFEDSILIVIDGKQYKITQIKEVRIYQSDLKINLLRLNGYEFWNKVAEKFL